MDILVINCGSSSLKYQLLDMRDRTPLASGLAERIGEGEGRLHHRWRSSDGEMQEIERAMDLPDHRTAFTAVTEVMQTNGGGRGLARLDAIGHRVVHGGESFKAPTRIDAQVLASIRQLIPLAPLHNPANLTGIEACLEFFSQVPQVAVFDTAFHQTMPPHAFHYALPRKLYAQHQVRRYGFHGTSHAYVAKRAAEYLGKPLDSLRVITLHLGNGASATAIAGGKSIDTSMGFTPLEGLVMGTRCGDIDPALVFYLARNTGLDCDAIETMLNKESGTKGLCGVNDMREILARVEKNDPDARLALDLYCYRIRKYIGAYVAALGGVDALVFTAGIGENAPQVRRRACSGLEGLGIAVDPARNATADGEVAEIQRPSAQVKLLVIRTNEELEIAEQTYAVVGRSVG